MSYSLGLREISQPFHSNIAMRASSIKRGAVDIGSGKIKVQVSEVDYRLNTITQPLFYDYVAVPFKEDLDRSLDGRLSETIQQQAIDVVRELQQKVQAHEPNACVGVATEFVRQAKNGEEFLLRLEEETNLHVNAITQEEEGILGFLTATAAAKTNPENTVVWDSGNGSLQITGKFGNEYTVFCCQLGKIAMLNLFLKLQGQEPGLIKSPNPVSQQEVNAVLQIIDSEFDHFPQKLREKLSRPDVTVLKIGTHPLGEQSREYSKERIMTELQRRLELSDEEILPLDNVPFHGKTFQTDPRFAVPNLAIAYGVMNNLGIELARYAGAKGGNTSGILLSPQYWDE